MLNQIVIAGRLTSDPEILEDKEGKKYSTITIAVPRAYKNADGVYDTDFVKFTVWNAIAENINEYCRKGDVVGVKGRVQTDKQEDGSYQMSLIAEKVSFLSTSRKED